MKKYFTIFMAVLCLCAFNLSDANAKTRKKNHKRTNQIIQELSKYRATKEFRTAVKAMLDAMKYQKTMTKKMVSSYKKLGQPINRPQPAHVEGFGEGPLPSKPTDENLPVRKTDEQQEQNLTPKQVEQIELEMHTSNILEVNNKMIECRNAYIELYKIYNEYLNSPTPKLKEEGQKQKDNLLDALNKLLHLAIKNNDTEGMEESAQLRREVNKMVF